MHVYAAQPAARFVLIDGRRYREGQDIATDLRLERITADGVVLSYQGQPFRMALR
jgi:general secretion pathway protein B